MHQNYSLRKLRRLSEARASTALRCPRWRKPVPDISEKAFVLARELLVVGECRTQVPWRGSSARTSMKRESYTARHCVVSGCQPSAMCVQVDTVTQTGESSSGVGFSFFQLLVK